MKKTESIKYPRVIAKNTARKETPYQTMKILRDLEARGEIKPQDIQNEVIVGLCNKYPYTIDAICYLLNKDKSHIDQSDEIYYSVKVDAKNWRDLLRGFYNVSDNIRETIANELKELVAKDSKVYLLIADSGDITIERPLFIDYKNDKTKSDEFYIIRFSKALFSGLMQNKVSNFLQFPEYLQVKIQRTIELLTISDNLESKITANECRNLILYLSVHENGNQSKVNIDTVDIAENIFPAFTKRNILKDGTENITVAKVMQEKMLKKINDCIKVFKFLLCQGDFDGGRFIPTNINIVDKKTLILDLLRVKNNRKPIFNIFNDINTDKDLQTSLRFLDFHSDTVLSFLIHAEDIKKILTVDEFFKLGTNFLKVDEKTENKMINYIEKRATAEDREIYARIQEKSKVRDTLLTSVFRVDKHKNIFWGV